MSLVRQFVRGVRALTRRVTTDGEIRDEVQHYLDEATAAHRARGLSPQAALRAARLELGSESSVREQMRSYGWENVAETLFADVRFAVRRLGTEPGFAAITVLTLALGLGGTTAIFSAVKPIVFEPLPYPDAGRLAMVWELQPDGVHNDGTFGMYRELAARNQSFAALGAYRPWQPTNTGAEQPERFQGQRVSASYFQVLGVAPALGRVFHPADDRLNGPNVVVLSDALWRRRWGGQRDIIGQTITLDDQAYEVIGVMPRTFENVLSPAADVWAPLQFDMSQGRAWGHQLRMVARLHQGVRVESATEELNTLGNAVLQDLRPPTYGRAVRFIAAPLHEDVTRAVKSALLAILFAVTLVLAIACVNVTNLLLARAAHRHGEFALRAALGAGQLRLLRQLLTESLLLALLGGLAGLAVAILGVRALVALSPADLPRLSAIRVDGSTFAFGFAITTLIGLVCGAIPALQAARSNPQRSLQQGTRRTVSGNQRTRSVLVVAEVALALLLLVGSGLLLRSLQRLFSIDAGFNTSHLLTVQVQTSNQRYSASGAAYQFFTEALEAARRVPGVTAAALTSQLPLSGDSEMYGVHFEPSLALDPGEIRGTFRYAVSPGYLETMGIPLRRGRLLNELDHADAPRVALVSQSLARRRLPGLDPIGQRLRVGSGPLYTVVGVVGDVKQMSLTLNETEAVYVTPAQWRFADNVMSLIVRTRGSAVALTDAIRQAIWSVDKDQPIVRVATMDELVAATAAERRFALILFQAFALAALMLAAAGIYGLLAGSVAERTREMGVRAALGASRTRILALVLGQGMTLTGLGMLAGVAGALPLSRVLETMLFDVSPLDSITYISGIALLAAVALLACAVPAWRAARVDPARTLAA